jgi:hypothetical protein
MGARMSGRHSLHLSLGNRRITFKELVVNVYSYVSYFSQGSDSVECLVRGNERGTGADTAVNAKTVAAAGRSNAAARN